MLDLAVRFILFPILLFQGVNVRYSTLSLANPAGRLNGVSGKGPILRLLIIGDSSAMGVGTSHQEEALLGQIRKRLSQTNTLYWSVDAKNGATTAETIDRIRKGKKKKFDVVSVSLGVNDVTKLVPFSVWKRRFLSLIKIIELKFQADIIYISGVPQMQYFPLLPQPLRWVVGAQANRFHRALRKIVINRAGCRFIEMNFDPDISRMSSDGFHPGPKIYAEWGRRVYIKIRKDIKLLKILSY